MRPTRARKPSRTPRVDAVTRNTDEIVRDIVKKIDDARIDAAEVRRTLARDPEPVSGYRSNSAKFQPLFGYRSDNVKYTSRLERWAAEGERLMHSVPPGIPFVLFFSRSGDAGAVEQARKDCDTLRRVLPILQKHCKRFLAKPTGEHRHYGAHQERAAFMAAGLCLQARKPLAATSPTSVFREVASLLFEILSGQQGASLERACRAVAYQLDKAVDLIAAEMRPGRKP